MDDDVAVASTIQGKIQTSKCTSKKKKYTLHLWVQSRFFVEIAIAARTGHTTEVLPSLRPIDPTHKNLDEEHIPEQGYESGRRLLTVNFNSVSNISVSSEPLHGKILSISELLKPHIKISLVKERHKYCAMKKISTEPWSFGCNFYGSRVFLLIMHDGFSNSLWKTVLYVCFNNNHSGLWLSDVKFLKILTKILAYVSGFRCQYGASFSNVCIVNFAEHLRALNVLHGVSFNTFFHYVTVATLIIPCPAALCFVKIESPERFWEVHVHVCSLLLCHLVDTFHLFRAAYWYVLMPDRPENGFPSHSF